MNPWIQILVVIGILFFLSIALILVRKDRFRSGGSLDNALQAFHASFEPGARHTLVESQKEQIEEDDSGAPPLLDKTE